MTNILEKIDFCLSVSVAESTDILTRLNNPYLILVEGICFTLKVFRGIYYEYLNSRLKSFELLDYVNSSYLIEEAKMKELHHQLSQDLREMERRSLGALSFILREERVFKDRERIFEKIRGFQIDNLDDVPEIYEYMSTYQFLKLKYKSKLSSIPFDTVMNEKYTMIQLILDYSSGKINKTDFIIQLELFIDQFIDCFSSFVEINERFLSENPNIRDLFQTDCQNRSYKHFKIFEPAFSQTHSTDSMKPFLFFSRSNKEKSDNRIFLKIEKDFKNEVWN